MFVLFVKSAMQMTKFICEKKSRLLTNATSVKIIKRKFYLSNFTNVKSLIELFRCQFNRLFKAITFFDVEFIVYAA